MKSRMTLLDNLLCTAEMNPQEFGVVSKAFGPNFALQPWLIFADTNLSQDASKCNGAACFTLTGENDYSDAHFSNVRANIKLEHTTRCVFLLSQDLTPILRRLWLMSCQAD